MFNIPDTLVGVVIGGILGALPGIATVIASCITSKRQRDHEIHLKALEIVEQPRLDALREYALHVGRLCSGDVGSDAFPTDSFLAIHERAALYVSDTTFRAMESALPKILSGYHGYGADDPSALDRMCSPEIQHLNCCLRREIRSPAHHAYSPARRSKHK